MTREEFMENWIPIEMESCRQFERDLDSMLKERAVEFAIEWVVEIYDAITTKEITVRELYDTFIKQ